MAMTLAISCLLDCINVWEQFSSVQCFPYARNFCVLHMTHHVTSTTTSQSLAISISQMRNPISKQFRKFPKVTYINIWFNSVQFSRSVIPDSLWPQGLQHARPPCPSSTPGVYSKSYPLSRWCHPTNSSSAFLFSSCLQSFPCKDRLIKDTNGMDLTEAEILRKDGKNTQKNCTKKIFMIQIITMVWSLT